MPQRTDTTAVLEKYRKWAETSGFMHQVFDHRTALLEVWDALAQEMADREALQRLLLEQDAGVFGIDPRTGVEVAPWTADECYDWHMRARQAGLPTALTARAPTPKPPAPDPQILTTDWPPE